jgi:CubicO group peptidase (beta-lactamase class C family)
MLAMALPWVAGRPYAELLQEAVLAPLGLGATGCARPDDDDVMDMAHMANDLIATHAPR